MNGFRGSTVAAPASATIPDTSPPGGVAGGGGFLESSLAA